MSTDRPDLGTGPTAAPGASDSAGPAARPSSLAGYELGETIGKGGMGEVVQAHDLRIGRDIAIKRMHAPDSQAATTRFLREAQIQARIEHPAIVPVYEIGHGRDGSPFFAMKRVAGTTLADAIRREHEPRQRLLRAFVDVCRAIDFAHARGVVHRDLKPANIILGEFGEVYVLDWGVARVLREREQPIDDVPSLDGTMTQAGATLGTPGYMAPEQVRDAATAGTAADIYALGSILFEILAHEPLHPRGMAALAPTVAGVDGSPAARAPGAQVPPELDELCSEAIRLDPAARPTARALADRVESYVDGDRDLARRRALARDYVTSAREALAGGEPERRIEALRLAGSAVALDPESREAAELFARIMLEPPRVLPAGLAVALDESDRATQRRQSRVAAMSFAAIAAFLVAISGDGVRSWTQWTSVAVVTAIMAVTAWRMSRHSPRPGAMLFVVVGNAVLASLFSRAFGSLIVAPAVTCVMALSLTSYPQLIARGKLVIALLVASWVLPVALERAGALEPTWTIVNGVVRSTSTMCEIGGASTAALLVGANITAIVVIGLFANALAASRRDAQRAVEIQAWHLRQLVPES